MDEVSSFSLFLAVAPLIVLSTLTEQVFFMVSDRWSSQWQCGNVHQNWVKRRDESSIMLEAISVFGEYCRLSPATHTSTRSMVSCLKHHVALARAIYAGSPTWLGGIKNRCGKWCWCQSWWLFLNPQKAWRSCSILFYIIYFQDLPGNTRHLTVSNQTATLWWH